MWVSREIELCWNPRPMAALPVDRVSEEDDRFGWSRPERCDSCSTNTFLGYSSDVPAVNCRGGHFRSRDSAVLNRLRAIMTSEVSGRSVARTMNPGLVRGLMCLVMLWPAARAAAQPTAVVFPDPGKTSMSRENQQALGMKVAAEVYQQMPVLPDTSPEAQYIRQLGQKLVATIPKDYSWPFDFHVVPQKEINAFALPGGQMFVNIGTITAAKNEAELAGVMGHEMSHVYMQHSAKQAGKAQTTSMLAGLASIAMGVTGVGNMAGGLVGQLGQMGIQMGSEGVMMKHSRNDESQADAVGTVILYKAGYNPQSMADFFKILESQGGEAPPEFFSSHPNPGHREQAIQKQITNWPAQTYSTDTSAFAEIRQHAAGVQAYNAEQIAQGAKSGQWTQ